MSDYNVTQPHNENSNTTKRHNNATDLRRNMFQNSVYFFFMRYFLSSFTESLNQTQQKMGKIKREEYKYTIHTQKNSRREKGQLDLKVICKKKCFLYG